jgi:diadenosine tetraphosphate (Ap4A) HIT family hydrolase
MGLRRLIRDLSGGLVKAATFERYTDRARRVVALANDHAKRLNHEVIATEHLLLGLAEEGSGMGAHALKSLNVDLTLVVKEVLKRTQPGRQQRDFGKLPLAPGAHTVVERAITEARRLGHNYVGTEHLLLGMLHEEGSVAAEVLNIVGVTLESARRAVRRILGGSTASEPENAPSIVHPGCPLCENVAKANAAPSFVSTLSTSCVFLGENQGPRGWCILTLKDHRENVADLHTEVQLQVWRDVARLAAAIRSVFPTSGKAGGPPRINYECLGNLVPHIHWHIIPRHADDPDPTKAVWVWPEDRLRGTMTNAQRQDLIAKLRAALNE